MKTRKQSKTGDGTERLRSAFRGMGLSKESAALAAQGRDLREAVTDGSGFFASDYAYVGSPEDATTWRFLLVNKPGDGATGGYIPELVKAAAITVAAPTYAVAQVDIPAADLPALRQTLRGAWIQCALPLTDMPPALAEEALRAAFRSMGMSPERARLAAEGGRK